MAELAEEMHDILKQLLWVDQMTTQMVYDPASTGRTGMTPEQLYFFATGLKMGVQASVSLLVEFIGKSNIVVAPVTQEEIYEYNDKMNQEFMFEELVKGIDINVEDIEGTEKGS